MTKYKPSKEENEDTKGTSDSEQRQNQQTESCSQTESFWKVNTRKYDEKIGDYISQGPRGKQLEYSNWAIEEVQQKDYLQIQVRVYAAYVAQQCSTLRIPRGYHP